MAENLAPAPPVFEPPLPDAAALPRNLSRLQGAGWGVLDQALYGLTNLALSIFVARAVTQEAFGAFAVVLVAYVTSIGAVEGLTAEVFSVIYSGAPAEPTRRGLQAVTGCALALGLAGSASVLAISFLVEGSLGGVLRAFALVLPALFVQDIWRYAFFAMGRPKAAVLNDAVWAAVQAVALVAVTMSGEPSVSAFVLAWGCGATAGALLGMVQTRTVPRLLLARAWLSDHGALGWRFASEFLTVWGAAQAAILSVGLMAGLAELASIRAAQVIFTPLSGLLNAVRLAVTPIAVRVRNQEVDRLWRFTVLLSMTLGIVAVAWGAVAYLLPDRVGRSLLGDSWTGATAVIRPMVLSNAALAVGLGALTALRATRAAHRSLRVRLIFAGLVLIFGVAGAAIGGAVGSATGVAVASVVGMSLLLLQARVAVDEAVAS